MSHIGCYNTGGFFNCRGSERRISYKRAHRRPQDGLWCPGSSGLKTPHCPKPSCRKRKAVSQDPRVGGGAQSPCLTKWLRFRAIGNVCSKVKQLRERKRISCIFQKGARRGITLSEAQNVHQDGPKLISIPGK